MKDQDQPTEIRNTKRMTELHIAQLNRAANKATSNKADL
jgi:hypothetical protein